MLTICAYLGTIQGAEPNLSPNCKKKKCPEPGPNGLSVSGPVGLEIRDLRKADHNFDFMSCLVYITNKPPIHNPLIMSSLQTIVFLITLLICK